MMYRRIFTSLGVVLAALAVAVPVATAGSQQALVRQQLGEIGAWAVPETAQSQPSVASQRALVRQKLEEIGAWAVPSKPATTGIGTNSGDFNWDDVGIGAALALCALLLGVAGVLSIRRHHRPIPH